MKRHSTDRLFVAVALTMTGALISVLVGLPEVALFVAPWAVLCVLGLTQHQPPRLAITTEASDERILVGDDVQVIVTVDSSTDGLARLQPRPSRDFGMDADQMRQVSTVEAVVANQQSRYVFDLEAHDWGTHDLGQIDVDFSAPYGLFHMTGTAHQRTAVRVHPSPRQLDELLTPWLVRRVSGAHRSRESARGVEYADIRPFAAGDSVRDINWRASARSNDMWVSQRHPDRATDVVLLLDSFVETGHDVRNVFGLVIESALALAENHLAATDRVGMVEFGGLVRWVAPSTGRAQLQRLTDALLATGLYANAADKDLPRLSTRALPPRSFVVAFTPLLDERFIDAIFAARGRGHDVAVVECAPFNESAPTDPADTAKNESQRVAQLSRSIWEAERAQLRDRMAEQGIAVAPWDGEEHLDVTLGDLMRRRRRSIRVGARQ